jgi:hypothetical protein
MSKIFFKIDYCYHQRVFSAAKSHPLLLDVVGANILEPLSEKRKNSSSILK